MAVVVKRHNTHHSPGCDASAPLCFVRADIGDASLPFADACVIADIVGTGARIFTCHDKESPNYQALLLVE